MNRQPLLQPLVHALLSALTGRAPEQAKQHVPSSRPAGRDADTWHTYWDALGQPWRREPEIDLKRQAELARRRAVVPDIARSIYPFKEMKLNRADVEWLLAMREHARGPVDGSDERQRAHQGLDLRGAHLSQIDLRDLPLAGLRGGLTSNEWKTATPEQRRRATIHLEGADLGWAHLQKAYLREAQLQGANLSRVQLDGANLAQALLDDEQRRGPHLADNRMGHAESGRRGMVTCRYAR